ncbi:unnamed protein product [Dicrocoelium dendriticum]|nr:unnamed protein product [Dicrocoelium dendriticum]
MNRQPSNSDHRDYMKLQYGRKIAQDTCMLASMKTPDWSQAPPGFIGRNATVPCTVTTNSSGSALKMYPYSDGGGGGRWGDEAPVRGGGGARGGLAFFGRKIESAGGGRWRGEHHWPKIPAPPTRMSPLSTPSGKLGFILRPKYRDALGAGGSAWVGCVLEPGGVGGGGRARRRARHPSGI